jgi:hypothetical protein
MRFMKTTAAAASIAVAAFAFTPPALADADDAIIAGAAGFAAGTLFGTAASRPYYVPPRAVYGPSYGYYAPAPVYRRAYGPAPVRYGVRAAGTRDWYAYCNAKYRSFDPRSGTYLGYDGERHRCR